MTYADHIIHVGITLCKMRLIAQGALAVYDDESQSIIRLANSQKAYEAIQTLDILYTAIFDLLKQIEALHAANTQVIYTGGKAE